MDAKMKMKHEAMANVLSEIADMARSAMGSKLSGMKKPSVSVEIEQEDGEEDMGSGEYAMGEEEGSGSGEHPMGMDEAKSISSSMDKTSPEDDKMKLLKAKAMMGKK